MKRKGLPRGASAFLDRHGERLPEAAWLAALGAIEQAVERAREGRHGRFGLYPEGEIRRLRRELAGALMLARFAVSVAEEREDMLDDLYGNVRQASDEAGVRRRREQTSNAERVRLLNAKARREGREVTLEERYPGGFGQGGKGDGDGDGV